MARRVLMKGPGCILCGKPAGRSYCQVCLKTICRDCLTDHSHGLDQAFPAREG